MRTYLGWLLILSGSLVVGFSVFDALGAASSTSLEVFPSIASGLLGLAVLSAGLLTIIW